MMVLNKKDKDYKKIVGKVDTLLKTVKELIKDPVFNTNIHGEQELSLDQTIELFTAIRDQFDPVLTTTNNSPEFLAGISDAS
tara:strand:+ start:176 stop:421 length:246 start_codon:yes stop_codon:yes gene_type:complete